VSEQVSRFLTAISTIRLLR